VRDQEGKICLLDIDVKGARDIFVSKIIECNYLFVKTPTIKDLEERLKSRKTESPESLKRRLDNAAEEIRFAEESRLFQRVLINDDLNEFIKSADHLIIKELY